MTSQGSHGHYRLLSMIFTFIIGATSIPNLKFLALANLELYVKFDIFTNLENEHLIFNQLV